MVPLLTPRSSATTAVTNSISNHVFVEGLQQRQRLSSALLSTTETSSSSSCNDDDAPFTPRAQTPVKDSLSIAGA